MRQVEPGWLARSLKTANDAVEQMSPTLRSTYRNAGYNISFNSKDVIYELEQAKRRIDQDFWTKAYLPYYDFIAHTDLSKADRFKLESMLEQTAKAANEQLINKKNTL